MKFLHKKRIPTTKIHMIAVEPRSGCPIINTEIMNKRINGFKKLLKELISDILLTEYPEIYKIKLSLQISDG